MGDRALYDPKWTAQEYNPGGARDDLGIETLSETILADLLPGINNQTHRARYYSFWAWALHGFINDLDVQPHTQDKFWEWLRGREGTLILAYLAHGCGGRFTGATMGANVWEGGEKELFAINWKALPSTDGGSYQQYYRGALEEMNIIVRDDKSIHDDLSREIGLGLAEAYGDAIASTSFVRKHLKSTHISKSDIINFSEHGCICKVGENERERQLLINAFFRFDVQDAFAIKRLASLSFFLDVIAQSKGLPLGQNDFRTVLYFWNYGGKHNYVPQANFIQPAQRWRIFQLRQIFVYAVEGLWSLFLHRIQDSLLSEGQYLEWLVSELDTQELGASWGIELPKKDLAELSLREFYEIIYNALPENSWTDGGVSLRLRLNEQGLVNAIRSDRTRLNPQLMAGSALLIFALIYWRSQLWNDSSGWFYLSEKFSLGRLSLENHIRQVDYAFKANWSVADWLLWLHKNHLWLQHRRVALDKLLSRKQDVYKFEIMVDENDEPGVDQNPRFRSLGTDTPKMNTPRFPSALNILTDLLVIEPEGGGFRLTVDGELLLQQFGDYQVPHRKENEND